MNISEMKPGDNHYMAYVGPPTQYDFMGQTQFRLLCSLGLRSAHQILDVGCGSLRAGRLFITYLNQGCYFGIEPNSWLIDEAIENQIGREMINMKKPQFSYNNEFDTNVFGSSQKFDYIIAQSILSHTGKDFVYKALNNFKRSLKPKGLVAATFIEGAADFAGNGWVYPGCVKYRHSTICNFAKDAGLFITKIPWYHPRQTWYLLSKDKSMLPNTLDKRHLTGSVLFDPDFADSYKIVPRLRMLCKKKLKQILPQYVKNILKRYI